MNDIEREIDRFLTLLRNKIRERGFTQLDVQEALGWGRSYISQLLTKQKSLRVEQVLLILSVIEIEPWEFFGELYHRPITAAQGGYEPVSTAHATALLNPSAAGEVGPLGDLSSDFAGSFRELRELLLGLLRVLVDNNVVNAEELGTAVQTPEVGRLLAELRGD